MSHEGYIDDVMSITAMNLFSSSIIQEDVGLRNEM